MALKKPKARSGRERRGSDRADARLSMRVDAGAIAGTTKIVTESQNISASGVYCHASHYLAPLSKVQLTIVLPRVPGGAGPTQELLKCDGIVVRCNQRVGDRTGTPYELACMFSGLDSDSRARLEEFVSWRNLQALRAALGDPAAPRSTPARAAAARRASVESARVTRRKPPVATPSRAATAGSSSARASRTRRAGRTSR
jgi:hypothetical protein